MINLSDYELIAPSNIEVIKSKNDELFYDLTVFENHTFFIIGKNGDKILTHNCDGAHIAGLLLGFFKRYAPDLIETKRVKRLKTPLIVIKKGEKIQEFFFTFDEFNEWQKKHKIGTSSICYKKGLGSWKKSELQQIIEKVGFEQCIEAVEADENTDKLIDDWLSDKKVEARKEYLRNNNFNIMTV